MLSPDRLLAMQKAIEDRNLAKVRLLLKAGVPAEHYYEPRLGWSFANLAARTGDFAIFCCLLDAGAKIRCQGPASMIQEAICSKNASMEIVAKVLAEGACTQEELDRTLLFAPEFGSLEIVGRLLDAGASPRYVDDQGSTSLIQAVLYKRTEIAIRLLQAGADPARRSPYEEHYKKTVTEIAAIHQMDGFLRACGSPAPASRIGAPPQTLQDCVRAINEWFRENVPELQLKAPQRAVNLPAPFRDAPGQADLRTFFELQDGSDENGIVPMASDISHCLMSLDDSLRERKGILEVAASECTPGAPESFFPETWLPLSSNGAGDYLVWDATTANVLHFSHESRKVSVRAASLLELLRDLAHGLQTGKYTYSPSRGVT